MGRCRGSKLCIMQYGYQIVSLKVIFTLGVSVILNLERKE